MLRSAATPSAEWQKRNKRCRTDKPKAFRRQADSLIVRCRKPRRTTAKDNRPSLDFGLVSVGKRI